MTMRKVVAALGLVLLSGCSVQANQPELGFSNITLDGQSRPAVTPSQIPEDSDYAVDSRADIDIEDQQGDGNSVVIEELKVGRDNTFLVIYDTTGLVLASAKASPQSQPVQVSLDIPVTVSQELEAALYLDDGDGVFSLQLDRPLVDYEGEIVHEDFYYRVVSN